jgi:GNAT superfamily N-acetyltransferase
MVAENVCDSALTSDIPTKLKLRLILFVNRIATSTDMPQIADLRWRLRVDDEPVSDRGAYEHFIADFVRVCETEWPPNENIHWTAADGKIALVRKLPTADNLTDRCGCISNSYVLPEVRNAGVGNRLLMAIKGWTSAEHSELLVVWPSERAYPSYERAGFSRHPDPLVLRLRRE